MFSLIKHHYIYIYIWLCLYIAIYIYIKILGDTTELTHFGLVMLYGDINLGQHWLWSWLDAWWQQAITWANVAKSLKMSSSFHLGAMPQEVFKIFIHKTTLKIIPPKLQLQTPGAIELWLWSVPSHYLNQHWNILNWTLRNKIQWNLNRNSYSFI